MKEHKFNKSKVAQISKQIMLKKGKKLDEYLWEDQWYPLRLMLMAIKEFRMNFKEVELYARMLEYEMPWEDQGKVAKEVQKWDPEEEGNLERLINPGMSPLDAGWELIQVLETTINEGEDEEPPRRTYMNS